MQIFESLFSTPPVFEDFTTSSIVTDPVTGTKKPEEQPPEEQSFFKKYV